MAKRTVILVALLVAMLPALVSSQSALPPREIQGVEITKVEGWLAIQYFWKYDPETSTVHPPEWLHEPWEFQTPTQVKWQTEIAVRYGSGADIVEFNPNLDHSDYNQILSTYLTDCNPEDGNGAGGRAFMILLEHVFGTKFVVDEYGRADMSLEVNRQIFEGYIDFVWQNIIWPCRGRYLSWEKKALIYLWSMGDMTGDVPSLFDKMRAKYPIAFIGSLNIMYLETDESLEAVRSFQALNGFLEYIHYPVLATPEEKDKHRIAYSRMVGLYLKNSLILRIQIGEWEERFKKKYLYFGSMTFAFDDTKVPERKGLHLPMYPLNEKEVRDFAEIIKRRGGKVASKMNEYAEGDAVGLQKCLPETMDTPDRFVGCGSKRLEILAEYFGRGRK